MKNLAFESLDLTKGITRAISDLGFEEPTPIQIQSIPLIRQGLDVIGQAQTGTGKTAAFGIPILEKVNPSNKAIQAIVLCPTRELAIQVAEEFRKLSRYIHKIKTLPIYGGQPIDRQIRSLKKGVQIVIGTPGRVLDHIRRRTIKLDAVEMFVLDEADEMLDMGFREDIELVLSSTPEKRQLILFSATIPKQILELAEKYQNKPQLVKVVHRELTVPNIEQVYYEVKERDKLEVFSRLMDIYNPKLALVFCNTKRKVDELVERFAARGYFVDGLHGDLKQQQRDRVMEKFRNNTIDILIATDVAARGIDVGAVEAVFNYDLPQNEEYYVHRIGRTGRAGKGGLAITFVAGREIHKLKYIQKYTKKRIKFRRIPSLSDVEESRINLFLDRVRENIEGGDLEKYVVLVERLLQEEFNSLDVAAALMKMTFDLDSRNTETENGYTDTGAEAGMVRLFINVGRKQKIRPGDIVGSIAGETGLSGKLIGSIDIHDKFTFVEVPREYASDVLRIMKDNQIKGNRINIEPAIKQ